MSDRLVTTPSGAGYRPFDAASNKTVVFHARDGVAVLSYSGLAYVDGDTTDTWIAIRLNGDRPSLMPDGSPFTMRFGRRPGPWPFMGPALVSIADGLAEVARRPSSTLSQTPIVVSVCGWLWYRRKPARPFLASIFPTQPDRYEVAWCQRIRGDRYLVNATPNGYLTSDQVNEIVAALRPLDLEESGRELVTTIRGVAARSPAVGGDCMVVSIAPPFSQDRVVSVEYLQWGTRTYMSHGAESHEVAAGYSPWLVARNLLVAPSVLVGAAAITFKFGHYSAAIRGPSTESSPPFGIAALHESQKRPSYP